MKAPEVTQSLVRLDAARQALASCKNLDDIKKIRDQAAALQAYTKAQGLSQELQAKAASIRIDAEARLGELERERVPDKGESGRKVSRALNGEAKFSKKERERFRALARVPEDRREELKAQLGADATPTGLLKLARGITRGEREAEVFACAKKGPEVVADLPALIERGARYGTVYADPPWAYGNQGTRAATGQHYVTMSVDEIAALPVKDVVLDLAHLHLWTTNAFLFDARRVMEAWGFEYKSCFVWVKPDMGIGNYWRVSHEFLLLGTRGVLTFRDRSLKSWAEMPTSSHSAKPEAVRAMVERASPGPYLELFGRSWVDGDWTVLGNEVGPGQRALRVVDEVPA